MPVAYWEPLLRGQIEDLVEDGLLGGDIRNVIESNVVAYRNAESTWTGRPTDTEISQMIIKAGGHF